MDLTTLLAAAFLLVSAIGFDTVLHPRDIVLEAVKSDHLGKIYVTDRMLSDLMKAEVDEIFLTPSIVSKPVIHTTGKKGIGLSITDTFGMSHVADALQEQAGYSPDQIRLYLYSESDTVKVLVNGFEAQHKLPFQQEVNQVADESVVSLVDRATAVGVAYIDPYMTALNLMRRHIKDGNFKRSEDVIEFARLRLSTTAVNPERSMLENLEGMIALFKNDPASAHLRFQRAADSNPENQIAVLNLALSKIALGLDAPAADLLNNLVDRNPPTNRVILGTAHSTLAGAYLGLHQPAKADAEMKLAAALNPSSPAVFITWAEVKRQNGDMSGGQEMSDKAHTVQNQYDDYAEVAALYFTLTWQDGKPNLRSPLATETKAPDTTNVTAPAAPETAKKAEPAVPESVAKQAK